MKKLISDIPLSIPFSIIIFFITCLYPNDMSQLGPFYNYEFGILNFLEIRRKDIIIGNIFSVGTGSENFSILVGNMIGSYLLAFFFSVLLIEFIRRIDSKKQT